MFVVQVQVSELGEDSNLENIHYSGYFNANVYATYSTFREETVLLIVGVQLVTIAHLFLCTICISCPFSFYLCQFLPTW